MNYITAPAYKTKKFLNKHLRSSLIIPNQYNIKNSKHLLDNLRKLKVNPHTKLISLDIDSMYTNIPRNETINIKKEQLVQLGTDTNILDQGSSTRGPRAACGPRTSFVRPGDGISQNAMLYEY